MEKGSAPLHHTSDPQSAGHGWCSKAWVSSEEALSAPHSCFMCVSPRVRRN